jgi:hypothetical protein
MVLIDHEKVIGYITKNKRGCMNPIRISDVAMAYVLPENQDEAILPTGFIQKSKAVRKAISDCPQRKNTKSVFKVWIRILNKCPNAGLSE